jgi:tetratricopeptide (TPR) repeat protein/TolB-like protein
MTKDFALTELKSQQPTGLRWTADRLDSWKDIANHFGRTVRTVQLWEEREGLPIHRHFHKQLGSVFAFRSELDAWRSEASTGSSEPQAEAAAATFKTPKPIQGHKVLRVQPLHKKFMSQHQCFCDAIVDKTVLALEQVNPGQLIIDSSQPALRADSLNLAQCISESCASDYVLDWDVQDDGSSLRLHVELRSSENAAVVWSRLFSCQLSDFDEKCDHWADQIVQCVWLTIISSPASCPAVKRREKPGAREAYLKGRYFWNQRSKEGLRKALQFFEAAVQEDPDFALAYSGIADSLTLLSFYEIVTPSEAMPAARRAALRAIELDPDLAEAHASLADILFHFDRDWEGADCEYRRAIQYNPGYALAYHWYANLLAVKGLHEAAHIAIMHALEIDPVSPISLVWAGVTSHLAHNFDEAIDQYKRALDLDPHFIWTHMYLAQALEQTGQIKGAIREFETAIRLAGGSNCVLAMKAHAYAIAGDKTSARQILNRVKSSTHRKCMPSYDIAAVYAALGESRQMGVWLNRACDERNMKVFTLIQDPRFDRLRDRPEFKEVVDHAGLTQYNQTPTSPLLLQEKVS